MGNTNSIVQVNVRIEGRENTIYEDTILTHGHNVTPVTGPPCPADGTNGNENPFQVPTCTAALDDSARIGGFRWDGTFHNNLDDFFITTIAGDTARGPEEYWQLALNIRRANLGGGQMKIQNADSVVWALIRRQQAPANGLPLLKLKGSKSARVSLEVIVAVIDGETRQAVQGATVTVRGAGNPPTSPTDYQGETKIRY